VRVPLPPDITLAIPVLLSCADVFSELTKRGPDVKVELQQAMSGLVAGLAKPVFPFSHEQASLLLPYVLMLSPRVLFGVVDERSLGSVVSSSSESHVGSSTSSKAHSKSEPATLDAGCDDKLVIAAAESGTVDSTDAANSAEVSSNSKRGQQQQQQQQQHHHHHHRHHTKKRAQQGGKHSSKHSSQRGSVRGSGHSKHGGVRSLLGVNSLSASAATSHTTAEQKAAEQSTLLSCVCNLLRQLESEATIADSSNGKEVAPPTSVEQLCRRAHSLAMLLVDPQRSVPPTLVVIGLRILRETALKAAAVRVRVSRFFCKFLQHADLDKSTAYAQAEARAQLLDQQSDTYSRSSSVSKAGTAPSSGLRRPHPQKWEVCQVSATRGRAPLTTLPGFSRVLVLPLVCAVCFSPTFAVCCVHAIL
jgi:hypothetical protein